MQVAISKWGNSAALRLPNSVLKQVSASIGGNLEMKVEGNKIILEPSAPSLAQLLAQVTASNRHAEAFPTKAGNELL